VLISTTAVLSSVVTLPLVYNYIQAMQTHMSGELDHCRAKTRDLWVEVFAAQDSLNIRRKHGEPKESDARVRREWSFGRWIDKRMSDSPDGADSAAKMADYGEAESQRIETRST
ncbi:Nematode cuticle collagen domain protein, partial [Trichostrongylus colubriformis]